KGKKYEDHVYGERRTPYYGQYSAQAQPRMMKGSVGVPVNAAPQAPRVQNVQRTPRMTREQWLSRVLTGRYSDGTGYPKSGKDFMRR
ncbi:MAG: hypothetical protein V1648_04845, partial [Candidatus Aenigmatarchaeota archaeon]